MKQIDFFGCSFTEAPMWEMNPKLGELDILLYSMHTQSTKPVSNFLEFDLAYNNQSGYKVNNFGGGSFGNHVIKEILKNRIKNSNTKEGVAIVQLSALLRNTQSYENIFTSPYSSLTKSQKYGITEFNIIGENVRNDYFVETDNLEDYYNLHIKNIEEIVDLLKTNYSNYFIHFGWDVSTKEFERLWGKSDIKNYVQTYEYEYPINHLAYFENQSKYSIVTKKCKGNMGGMLDYSANHLEESLRYVHLTLDHHPSYFSNKIFYKGVIKPFLSKLINLEKDYFEEDNLLKFEEFLKVLLPTKESTDGKIYGEMQVKIVNYIKNSITNK
jgi:hypothetical protein